MTRESINELISANGFVGEIDLLSLDLDSVEVEREQVYLADETIGGNQLIDGLASHPGIHEGRGNHLVRRERE